jgi:hypothetical protein
MARSGHGVFEINSDLFLGGMHGEFAHDFDWIADLAEETGVSIFYLLNQVDQAPDEWKQILDRADEMNKERGINLVAMVGVRPPGVIMSLHGSAHPFKMHPSYIAMEGLTHEERLAELRKPEVKARILSEATTYVDALPQLTLGFDALRAAKPDYGRAGELSGETGRTSGATRPNFKDLLLERMEMLRSSWRLPTTLQISRHHLRTGSVTTASSRRLTRVSRLIDLHASVSTPC